MNIILVGGGTGGSVSPLLAVASAIKENHPKAHFVLVGSRGGVEELMARNGHIPFVSIPGGKLRRYFSLANFIAPFQVLSAFFRSFAILKSHKATCVFGAGSFLQVPVAWAAWFLRIPVVLHQQDIRPTFSNRLCAPIATKITTTFEKSLKDFPQGISILKMNRSNKLVWTGNPCRLKPGSITRTHAVQHFKLDVTLPTVLVMGGGTGAQSINSLVTESLQDLEKIVNIIHITGRNKGEAARRPHYYATEFLKEMDYAYAASEIVVSRAGLASITELSIFGKPSIIIPVPGSHQEDNARFLDNLNAALVVNQVDIDPTNFAKGLRHLLFNQQRLNAYADNIKHIMPHGAEKKIAEIILDICGNALK